MAEQQYGEYDRDHIYPIPRESPEHTRTYRGLPIPSPESYLDIDVADDEDDELIAFLWAIKTKNTRGLSNLEVRNESGVLTRSALDTVIIDLYSRRLHFYEIYDFISRCLYIILRCKSKISPYFFKEFMRSNIIGQYPGLYDDRSLKDLREVVWDDLKHLILSRDSYDESDQEMKYLMKLWIEIADTDVKLARCRGIKCWDELERSYRLRLAACRRREVYALTGVI